MNVAIIKYNAGNIYSIYYALKRLGVNTIITDNKELLQKADKIVFPGQGEAVKTMQYLKMCHLDELIKKLKQPVLGICIGMQLMCRSSEEGNVNCLGIFDIPVLKFHSKKQENKIPHIGWNTITKLKGHLYKNIEEESFVYFVHSYYIPKNEYTNATTQYIHSFSASLQKENFYATQFHLEKSGKIGEKILNNFLSL